MPDLKFSVGSSHQQSFSIVREYLVASKYSFKTWAAQSLAALPLGKNVVGSIPVRALLCGVYISIRWGRGGVPWVLQLPPKNMHNKLTGWRLNGVSV